MKLILCLAIVLLLIPVALITGGMIYDWVKCIRRDGLEWCDVFAFIALFSLVLGGWLLVTVYCFGVLQ